MFGLVPRKNWTTLWGVLVTPRYTQKAQCSCYLLLTIHNWLQVLKQDGTWEGSGELNVMWISKGFLELTSCLIISNAVHYVVRFVVLLGGRSKEKNYWHLKQNHKSLFMGDLKLDLSHGIVKLLMLESAGLIGFL